MVFCVDNIRKLMQNPQITLPRMRQFAVSYEATSWDNKHKCLRETPMNSQSKHEKNHFNSIKFV